MTINKSGNPVEFLSPGKADIRSLKVYFSPKQLGEGTPAPDNVRDIVGWDEVDVYNNRFLPKEYQEVEYLESIGTQYINLPFGFLDTDEVEIIGAVDTTISDRFMVAPKTWNNNANRFAIIGNVLGRFGTGFGNLPTTSRPFTPNISYNNDIHTWTYKNRLFSIVKNNEILGVMNISDIVFKAETTELKLFFGFNACTPGKICFYHHKKANGTEVNLIPCYRKSDSKPGMWDTVSKTFFTNSGTGEFLVGPDVESNGEVVTCKFPQTFYGGYVDLVSGELVEEWVNKTLDGSEYYNTGTNYRGENCTNAYINITPKAYGSFGSSNSVSDSVNKSNSSIWWDADLYPNTFTINNGNQLHICLPNSLTGIESSDTDAQCSNKFKSFIQNNNINFAYRLATPITHQLTPQSLQTLINQNTFWTNADRIEIEYDLIESMEMMDIRRRILFNNNPHLGIGTLKYWWSGEDGPNSNNKWVDRVSGIKPDVYGTNVWDSENKCYDFSTQSKYAAFDMNVANFNLGNHWRIVFDMDLSLSGNNSVFLDLGSVGNVSKAIGLSLFTTYDFSINWKMQGNNSNPGARITNTGLRPNDTDYHNYKGYYEIVDGGDGYDRFQVFINGVKYVCDVQIPKAQYGPKWNNSGCYFGRGYTSGYNSNVKFYDLKIYQID